MFSMLSRLLQWTNMIVLIVAVAIGGCSAMTVGQMEKRFEVNAPSDQVELTKEIQKMLTKKGFYDGSIDGIGGTKTLLALTAYQKKNGLPSTNGINAKAYGQLSIWDSNRELERRKREQQDEQTRQVKANNFVTDGGNSSSEGSSTSSSGGNVAEREAAKRKELSRNDASVNFQVSCPGLYIPKVYEKKYQGMIPVYAMAVLNNSSKRYSVQYDLVYTEGTDAVPSKRVFGTTFTGRQGYSRTQTETKDFAVRPGTFTEFLLIEKNQGAGAKITGIEVVDVFKCTSP
jgi:peptidoglycan hydrolase-like protein with peptidoglycan-binding domain